MKNCQSEGKLSVGVPSAGEAVYVYDQGKSNTLKGWQWKRIVCVHSRGKRFLMEHFQG